MEKPNKYVSELEFGLIMLGHKNTYPLEVVSAILGQDENGKYFIPCTSDYVDFEQNFITGNENGYESREQLMRCIGRCWDKAEAHQKKLLDNHEVLESKNR